MVLPCYCNTHFNTCQQLFLEDIVKYAFWPDVLTSKMADEMMVLWVTLRTSLGERFIHHRMEEPWDGLTVSEMGMSDIWLRFLRQFFWFYWVLWFGPGNTEALERFNTDISLMFSEMVRLTFWHHFYWFRPFPPLACQSKRERCQIIVWISNKNQ